MPALTRRRATALAGASILLPRFAHAAEINWKFTSAQPATHPSTQRYMEAAQRVKDKSNGKFEITVFHSGQLGTDIDTYTQIRIGAIQMMVLSNVITATAAPLTSALSMPFAFDTYEQVWAAADGKLQDLLREDLRKAGYLTTNKILDDGFHQLTSNKAPIHTVADLQGLKLRAPPSPIQVSLWKAIGAAPASMNFAELFTALQTGVVDGQESAVVLTKTTRLYEVQKYMSMISVLWDGWYTLINPRAFGKLPKDMQDLVMAEFDQAGLDVRKDMSTLIPEALAFLTEKGMVMNKVEDRSAFKKKLQDVGFYAEWRDKLGPDVWKALQDVSGPLV
ncbi:MAG: TRAP transporter substrate-binding protein [Acetobacteraceae bacterium]|nr:TRAP transporter substrate-binding protein [Pseudomonadota bacterium]